MQIVSPEKVDIDQCIDQHLTDEKLYKKEHITKVLKLKPSESFVKIHQVLRYRIRINSN